MQEIDLALSDPEVYRDGERSRKLSARRAEASGTLEKALERWGALTEEMATLRAITEG